MKKEVYRCLKTLEAYKVGLFNMWTNGYWDSARSLQRQYSDICKELEGVLTPEEYRMIQKVEPLGLNPMNESDAEIRLINKLVVSVEMTIAYLRSLDMDLSRETTKKEIELKKRDEELKIKENEVESIKKVYGELVHIKRGLPEIIRSEVAKEIKKQHRGIEENTNPNTKSQQKDKASRE